MACAYAHKILYGAYMMPKEVKYWWDNARQRFEANGTMITWDVFKGEFLEKYIPTDVLSKKEVEFLELKQGNMIFADYAVNFEKLSRLFPHCNREEAKMSKYIKFENGLRPEIK